MGGKIFRYSWAPVLVAIFGAVVVGFFSAMNQSPLNTEINPAYFSGLLTANSVMISLDVFVMGQIRRQQKCNLSRDQVLYFVFTPFLVLGITGLLVACTAASNLFAFLTLVFSVFSFLFDTFIVAIALDTLVISA